MDYTLQLKGRDDQAGFFKKQEDTDGLKVSGWTKTQHAIINMRNWSAYISIR